MAWLTFEDRESFCRVPEATDGETALYWIQRLEPLLRAEQEEEILVILANRCGIEDNVLYVGSSHVIGIKKGKIRIYGRLGRGIEQLLLVDTGAWPR